MEKYFSNSSLLSHHSLIQSRTNHHQKYSFHRLLATTTTITNLNRRNNLKQAKSTRAYPNLCIVVNLEFRTQIFTIFFLYFYVDICTLCVCLFAPVQFYVVFCFSFGSMILQSSLLQFLPLDLKRSHFKFNIL